jgi:hypothetical protein
MLVEALERSKCCFVCWLGEGGEEEVRLCLRDEIVGQFSNWVGQESRSGTA